MAPTRMATKEDRSNMEYLPIEYKLDLSKYEVDTLVELTQDGAITLFELDDELSQRRMSDLAKLEIVRRATGAA